MQFKDVTQQIQKRNLRMQDIKKIQQKKKTQKKKEDDNLDNKSILRKIKQNNGE